MQRFFEVLFLYSAQYALFYLFMNLSLGMEHFFNDSGHIVLLTALLGQIIITYIYYKNTYIKVASTFITPFIYTLYDGLGQSEWIYNVGHSFFWIFTLSLAILIIINEKAKNNNLKLIGESLLVFLNISIFIFIYFYFDLKLSQLELLHQNLISAEFYKEQLEFYNLIVGFNEFVKDPAHIYLMFGGLFLGITIMYHRIQNLKLTFKIDNLLDTYLDTLIKEQLMNESEKGHKKDLVILFSDIRNFTTLSEKNNPDAVVDTLNVYYSYWNKIVKENGGVINKFIGDAVLVIFNFQEIDTHTKAINKAINCANDVLKNLPVINNTLHKSNLPTLEGIGIGVHYGEVILGSIGGDRRKDYTIIGDNVNIAARLESLCKEYNKNLIFSEEVYKELEDKKRFSFLDSVQLKGKNKETAIYSYK